ncbi:ADAMTS9 [Symbiodinium sp. CCMP2592]|nr:ADAMTS9 [Symbiodinium sp. CCMP2592]
MAQVQQGAELLDRKLSELEKLCRYHCSNRRCPERRKYNGVTDNASLPCVWRCYRGELDVTRDGWKDSTPRQIFDSNVSSIAEDEDDIRIAVHCATCRKKLSEISAQCTVHKLYHDLRNYIVNDKSQPLLFVPGRTNEDVPHDARGVCELTHRPAVDGFVANRLTPNVAAIAMSLQPGHALHKKLKEKGTLALRKFGDSNMTYIRIGLGLHDLGLYNAVLDIWPRNYRSPIHHHGGSAGSVRILHGVLNCKFFETVLDTDPIEFTGNDGRLELGVEKKTVLQLKAGDTTWLNRQNWFVHQFECHEECTFAMSVHLYMDCTDAFAVVQGPAGEENQLQRVESLEKQAIINGCPNIDFFWNIDLPAEDPRVMEVGGPCGPHDFETAVLHQDDSSDDCFYDVRSSLSDGDGERMQMEKRIKALEEDATKRQKEVSTLVHMLMCKNRALDLGQNDMRSWRERRECLLEDIYHGMSTPGEPRERRQSVGGSAEEAIQGERVRRKTQAESGGGFMKRALDGLGL